MTVKEAKEIFAHLMSVSRTRLLTTGQRKELHHASQIIRHARRTTTAGNKPKRKTTYRRQVSKRALATRKLVRSGNPAVLIYDKVTRIEATKGSKSEYPGQKFFHNFKKPYPKMYGLPDGSLLIK